jgi:hypothetical protein
VAVPLEFGNVGRSTGTLAGYLAVVPGGRGGGQIAPSAGRQPRGRADRAGVSVCAHHRTLVIGPLTAGTGIPLHLVLPARAGRSRSDSVREWMT